jgi:cyclic pyranopterin phosphate synthase
MTALNTTGLSDGFGRDIRYLRISVTDRCDFRCTYCMAEEMTFLPRKQVLSLEEISRLAALFVAAGVQKIRLTGGEPLVRRGIEDLAADLGSIPGLQTLAMTTNGSQLPRLAPALHKAGVTRLNISLDTLDPAAFRRITRTGDLETVLAGIEAARDAGIPRIRLNAVVLRGHNEDQVLPLARFAIERGVDLAFIEEMPLGQVNAAGKSLELVTSDQVRDIISSEFDLEPGDAPEASGPARYERIAGSDTQIGLISPHSNNFCASCNRLRLTAEGRLLLCLGNEDSISLRDLMRQGMTDDELLTAIRGALAFKPERHVFDQPDQPQILRFMNASGG